MEKVAESAGVSRSTAYRRFATKEDIVLEIPRNFLAAWDETFANAEPGETLEAATARGCLGVAIWIDDNAEKVFIAYQALAAAPTLHASDTSSWIGRFIALIHHHEPTLNAGTATYIAGAYMGAIDTMMHVWVEGGGATSVVEATKDVLELLRPILPS